MDHHDTDDCGTTYPSEEETGKTASNPIIGLVLHPNSHEAPTPAPPFSLARLSATPGREDWYQTNLSPSLYSKPQWVVKVADRIETTEPIAVVYRARLQDRRAQTGEEIARGLKGVQEDASDGDEEEEEDFDYDSANEDDQTHPLSDMEKIKTTKSRIMGMAVSPGGGTIAVFVTWLSTFRPERLFLGGLKSQVLFGTNLSPPASTSQAYSRLSTEARMWEWMYGGGPPVAGVSDTSTATDGNSSRKTLREKFAKIAQDKKCVFCKSALTTLETTSKCPKGHVFENCATTGIPIQEPGVSHTCGVCGNKCLKPTSILQHLEGYTVEAAALRAIIQSEVSSEACGGCGGKFVN